MDTEIRVLLQAVLDGRIRDPNRVREILREAGRVVHEVYDLQNLYVRARDAFLEDWPSAGVEKPEA